MRNRPTGLNSYGPALGGGAGFTGYGPGGPSVGPAGSNGVAVQRPLFLAGATNNPGMGGMNSLNGTFNPFGAPGSYYGAGGAVDVGRNGANPWAGGVLPGGTALPTSPGVAGPTTGPGEMWFNQTSGPGSYGLPIGGSMTRAFAPFTLNAAGTQVPYSPINAGASVIGKGPRNSPMGTYRPAGLGTGTRRGLV